MRTKKGHILSDKPNVPLNFNFHLLLIRRGDFAINGIIFGHDNDVSYRFKKCSIILSISFIRENRNTIPEGELFFIGPKWILYKKENNRSQQPRHAQMTLIKCGD